MTFDRGITLTTERMVLRPHTKDDVDDVVEAARDDEMLRWMWWAPDQTHETATQFCTEIAHEDPVSKICFAMEVDGRCSGSIALQRADWVPGRVEIGYWVARWARGGGLAAEACSALVSYGFEKGLYRVELLAAVGNVASQRVAERAGFTREGILRRAGVLPGGARADMVMYGLVRGDLG